MRDLDLSGPGWSIADPEEEAEQQREALRRLALPVEALAELQAEDPVAKRARETGIAGVKHDPSVVYRHGDGRLQAGVHWIHTAESLEKVRQGYRCLNCTEDFVENGLPAAFPEQCPVCGFRVRDDQTRQLEQDMRSPEWMGDDETPAQTEARWAEQKAENRWRRVGGHGILVPREVR